MGRKTQSIVQKLEKDLEKKESKKMKRIEKAVKKIDNMEAGVWFGLTFAYVFFVSILSGLTKAYLPDNIALFGTKIMLDPQMAVWMLGISLWVPISLILQAYFKRN
jgi:hypothetical protein